MWWLFDTTTFVTRTNCGEWTRELSAMYIMSSATIALSYFSMPPFLVLLWMHWHHKEKRKADVVLLFAVFTFLCGMTHAADVLVFWWAPYRFYTVILFVTAMVSVTALVMLPATVFHLLRMKSPAEYQEAVDRAEAELNRVSAMNTMLEAEVDSAVRHREAAERQGVDSAWYRSRLEVLDRLSREYKSLR